MNMFHILLLFLNYQLLMQLLGPLLRRDSRHGLALAGRQACGILVEHLHGANMM